MPIYDCGDPDCSACKAAFGPNRGGAIERYHRRAAYYDGLADRSSGFSYHAAASQPDSELVQKVVKAIEAATVNRLWQSDIETVRAKAAIVCVLEAAAAQPSREAKLTELLQKWIHDGHLQTFEDRERFRAEAIAALALDTPATPDAGREEAK